MHCHNHCGSHVQTKVEALFDYGAVGIVDGFLNPAPDLVRIAKLRWASLPELLHGCYRQVTRQIAGSHAAHAVGYDKYPFVTADEERIFIALADVSGMSYA